MFVSNFNEGVERVKKKILDDSVLNIVLVDLDGCLSYSRLIKYPFMSLLLEFADDPKLIPDQHFILMNELLEVVNGGVAIVTNRNVRSLDNVIWASSYLLRELELGLERFNLVSSVPVFLGMDRMVPNSILRSLNGNRRFIGFNRWLQNIENPNNLPIRFIILSDIDLASYTEYFYCRALEEEYPESSTCTVTIVGNRFIRNGLNLIKKADY